MSGERRPAGPSASPGTPGKAPIRSCVGCRKLAGPDQLVRVALVGGELQIGRTLPGRGAWLCVGSPSCLERAVKRRAFPKALRGQPAPGAEERLRETYAAISTNCHDEICEDRGGDDGRQPSRVARRED